jgi:hypothetical protein
MKCKIQIKMDNAAFTEDGLGLNQLYHFELARILRKLADKVLSEGESNWSIDTIPLHDINGNRVGELEILP